MFCFIGVHVICFCSVSISISRRVTLLSVEIQCPTGLWFGMFFILICLKERIGDDDDDDDYYYYYYTPTMITFSVWDLLNQLSAFLAAYLRSVMTAMVEFFSTTSLKM